MSLWAVSLGVGVGMASALMTYTFAARLAYFYHPPCASPPGREEEQGGIAVPEDPDVELYGTLHWCLTHRPAPVCTCGAYQLEWK